MRFGVVALGLLLPLIAVAQRVIPPGREPAVAALFAPYAVGRPVEADWIFDGFRIERDTIHVRLRAGDLDAGLILTAQEGAEASSVRTSSFAVQEVGPPSAAGARAALLAALRSNDDGTFWLVSAEPPRRSEHRSDEPLPRTTSRPTPWVAVGLALAALLGAALGCLPRKPGASVPSGKGSLESARGKDHEGGATAAGIDGDGDVATLGTLDAAEDEAVAVTRTLDP